LGKRLLEDRSGCLAVDARAWRTLPELDVVNEVVETTVIDKESPGDTFYVINEVVRKQTK
jgi:hypothetical protein